MKTIDLLLIALVCVNVSLGTVALALWAADAEPTAQAATSMRYGDYIMVTAPISTSREALLIIDVVAKRANLYVPSAGTGAGGHTFELKSTRNLAVDFGRGG